MIKKIFINLSLLLGSGLVSLSLCELSLRLFYPKYQPLAETQFSRSAARIWARIPNSRSVGAHPDTHLSHSLHHNNLALRQHRNFSEADLTAATNIGFFGDSFVENIRMAVQYSFTEPLDYLLNHGRTRFNVLNFGVDGYGPSQSFLYYEDFPYAKELDHVFFMYFLNDLVDIHETGLFHLDNTGQLVRHEAIQSSWWITFISRLHLSYLILDITEQLSFHRQEAFINRNFIYDREERISGGQRKSTGDNLYMKRLDDESEKDSFAIFQQLMRRWRQKVENNGGIFYVVLPPKFILRPQISSFFQEEDFETVNLYRCYGNRDETFFQLHWEESPYRFRNDSHWNEAGNQLAAICLYRFLEQKFGLPPLSEDALSEVLHRYYAAFEGWKPANMEGRSIAVFPKTAVAIRERYQGFDNHDSLSEMFRRLVNTPDKRILASNFDVYLDGRRLIYVKDVCSPGDTKEMFFLHVTPVDDKDLPEARVKAGFENLDFNQRGIRVGQQSCMVIKRLPDYAIGHIRTGQHVPGKNILWQGEVTIASEEERFKD